MHPTHVRGKVPLLAPARSPVLASVLALLMALAAPNASSRSDPSGLCTQAAAVAAKRSGVPYEVLLAISVVETGRDQRPWPWTVNLGGEGHWLDSADAAEALAAKALEQGATNIDLGCFQLNYRWHAEAFRSIPDMLDPERNAIYAAGFLGRHYSDTGDWALAAAAYHSATPEHADRYRARFETVLATLGSGHQTAYQAPQDERENRFPFLLTGDAGRNGSLVPATPGGMRLIGGP